TGFPQNPPGRPSASSRPNGDRSRTTWRTQTATFATTASTIDRSKTLLPDDGQAAPIDHAAAQAKLNRAPVPWPKFPHQASAGTRAKGTQTTAQVAAAAIAIASRRPCRI